MEKILLSPSVLKIIAMLLGTAGLGLSLWAFSSPTTFQKFLKELPRNESWARVLLLINVLWSTPLTANFLKSMEVPEQFLWLVYFVGAPFAFFYIFFFVNHYLGARMIGWFMILAAKPVLFACLVRDDPAKLVLVVLAYFWIVTGILIVAAPHLLRDLINLYLDKPALLKRSLQLKATFSIVLILLGLFVY